MPGDEPVGEAPGCVRAGRRGRRRRSGRARGRGRRSAEHRRACPTACGGCRRPARAPRTSRTGRRGRPSRGSAGRAPAGGARRRRRTPASPGHRSGTCRCSRPRGRRRRGRGAGPWRRPSATGPTPRPRPRSWAAAVSAAQVEAPAGAVVDVGDRERPPCRSSRASASSSGPTATTSASRASSTWRSVGKPPAWVTIRRAVGPQAERGADRLEPHHRRAVADDDLARRGAEQRCDPLADRHRQLPPARSFQPPIEVARPTRRDDGGERVGGARRRRAERVAVEVDAAGRRSRRGIVGSPAVTDVGGEVRLGSMLFTLVEPHRGHEVAYNRWYERDHFYAGCMVGPVAVRRPALRRHPRR